MDVLSHFGELDELIQVIYQGFDRFVVLSTVAESSWTLCVGLKGPEGRWWRGSWSTRDITQFIGLNPSSNILHSFAHNLSEAFVNGEICVGDWTPDPDAKINLTLGPTSKKPVRIPLVELSAKEAASYATTIFSGIALQAQSRKCRLNPPEVSTQTVTAAGLSRIGPGGSDKSQQGKGLASPQVSPPSKKARVTEPKRQVQDEAKVAQQKIKALEAELEHVKAIKKSKSPSSEVEPKPTRPPKGASLANPHKKARKYEAVEFESDEEEVR